MAAHTYNPRTAYIDRWIPTAHQPVSMADVASFQSNERPCLKAEGLPVHVDTRVYVFHTLYITHHSLTIQHTSYTSHTIHHTYSTPHDTPYPVYYMRIQYTTYITHTCTKHCTHSNHTRTPWWPWTSRVGQTCGVSGLLPHSRSTLSAPCLQKWRIGALSFLLWPPNQSMPAMLPGMVDSPFWNHKVR